MFFTVFNDVQIHRKWGKKPDFRRMTHSELPGVNGMDRRGDGALVGLARPGGWLKVAVGCCTAL